MLPDLANRESNPPATGFFLLIVFGGKPTGKKTANVIAFKCIPLHDRHQEVAAKAKPGLITGCLNYGLLGHRVIRVKFVLGILASDS
jgi:hypothetical protein